MALRERLAEGRILLAPGIFDALTGLMNRRAFDTALVEGIERSIKDRSPISLIMSSATRASNSPSS